MVGGAVMKINEGALPGRLARVLTDAVLRLEMPLAWLRPPARPPALLGTAGTEQIFGEIASP